MSSVGTSASWTVDLTAPSAPGLSGTPASPTNSTTASISFSGEANATFSCKLDSGSYSACGSSPKSLSGLADGSHTLYVKQTDQAGNEGPAASVTWTVDTTPVDTTAPSTPGLFTGVQAGGTSSSTSATIGFTLGEAGGTVECKVDSGVWGACTTVQRTSGSLVVTGLVDGVHTLFVRQTDSAGNRSVEAHVSWRVKRVVAASCPVPSIVGSPTSRFDRVILQRGESALGWRVTLAGSANSAKSYCALLTLQLSQQAQRPSATSAPKSFTYADGIYPYSGVVTRSGPKPTWARVQNQAGTWGQWVAVR